VKLRPKWSKIDRNSTAWQSRVRLLIALAMLGGCSDLDPNIGPRRTEHEEDVVEDAGPSDSDDPDVDPGAVSFARDIRPLINRPSSKTEPKGCKSCHYRTESTHNGLDLSGFDMTTLGALRQGGGSSGRRIIVAGKPAESVIIQVLKGQYAYSNKMPKNGPYWEDEDIGKVVTWISEGAKGADGE